MFQQPTPHWRCIRRWISIGFCRNSRFSFIYFFSFGISMACCRPELWMTWHELVNIRMAVIHAQMAFLCSRNSATPTTYVDPLLFAVAWNLGHIYTLNLMFPCWRGCFLWIVQLHPTQALFDRWLCASFIFFDWNGQDFSSSYICGQISIPRLPNP